MSQFQSYYAAIRQHTENLSKQHPDNAVLVVSVSAPGSRATAGTVCEVPVELAAKLLTENTHVLASESQIEEFHEAQRMNRPPINGLDAARAAFARLIQKGGPQ